MRQLIKTIKKLALRIHALVYLLKHGPLQHDCRSTEQVLRDMKAKRRNRLNGIK